MKQLKNAHWQKQRSMAIPRIRRREANIRIVASWRVGGADLHDDAHSAIALINQTRLPNLDYGSFYLDGFRYVLLLSSAETQAICATH